MSKKSRILYLSTIYSAVSVNYSSHVTSASVLTATFVSPTFDVNTTSSTEDCLSTPSPSAWLLISKAFLCFHVYILLKAQHRVVLRLQ